MQDEEILKERVSEIYPLTSFFELNCFSLNNSSLFPFKHYSNSLLHSSPLQLPPLSLLLLNESSLQNGLLQEKGFSNFLFYIFLYFIFCFIFLFVF
jgi:hypothetical protein